MADPGVSGQNFLRLLLGGAQKGVDQIPRQQAQQADLTLALQRMMQQQRQFDERQAGFQERHEEDLAFRKARADELDRQFRVGRSDDINAGIQAQMQAGLQGMSERQKARHVIDQAVEAGIPPELAAIIGKVPAETFNTLFKSSQPSAIPAKAGTGIGAGFKNRKEFWKAVDTRTTTRLSNENDEDEELGKEQIRLEEALLLATDTGFTDIIPELETRLGIIQRTGRKVRSGGVQQGPPSPGLTPAQQARKKQLEAELGIR